MNLAIFKRMLLLLLVTVGLFFISSCLALYLLQDKLVYHPLQPINTTPADLNMHYEDVYITSTDNHRIHGWYLPQADARASVLFFHGNAGNISHRLSTLEFLASLKLNVLIIDYQAYGQSEGKISEQATYDDAMAAWQFLINEKQQKPDNIILFGRSLGGAVAIWLASQTEAAALIVESSFTSLDDMGKDFYPLLPIKWLTRIHYPSHERLQEINLPILIAHSPNDEIVAFKHGENLFEKAQEPKYFFTMQGSHNDSFQQSREAYRNFLLDFLNRHLQQ